MQYATMFLDCSEETELVFVEVWTQLQRHGIQQIICNESRVPPYIYKLLTMFNRYGVMKFVTFIDADLQQGCAVGPDRCLWNLNQIETHLFGCIVLQVDPSQTLCLKGVMTPSDHYAALVQQWYACLPFYGLGEFLTLPVALAKLISDYYRPAWSLFSFYKDHRKHYIDVATAEQTLNTKRRAIQKQIEALTIDISLSQTLPSSTTSTSHANPATIITDSPPSFRILRE